MLLSLLAPSSVALFLNRGVRAGPLLGAEQKAEDSGKCETEAPSEDDRNTFRDWRIDCYHYRGGIPYPRTTQRGAPSRLSIPLRHWSPGISFTSQHYDNNKRAGKSPAHNVQLRVRAADSYP